MLPRYLFSQIKAVFFDAEGTLFHIRPSVGFVYAQVCASYGLQVSPEAMDRAFKQVFGHWRRRYPLNPKGCYEGWKQIFLKTVEVFGRLEDPEAAFARCYQAFARKEYFSLAPGAEETLKRLHEAGLKLAVISNWDERLRSLIKDFGLDQLFDDLIISCEVGLAKPDPAVYELACKRLKVKGEEVLMIGDHLEDDVLAARRAGLWALHYPGGDLQHLFPWE